MGSRPGGPRRPRTPRDRHGRPDTAVIDIYNHLVDHGFAAYRERRLCHEAYDRFLEMTVGYPGFVVVQAGGRVTGFAFLHAWHPAECFTRTVEITYLLHPDHTRRGLGIRLLAALIDAARTMGVDRLLASISSLNEPSLAFHRKHGFQECGRFEAVGRKHGRDFSVVWMIKTLE